MGWLTGRRGQPRASRREVRDRFRPPHQDDSGWVTVAGSYITNLRGTGPGDRLEDVLALAGYLTRNVRTRTDDVGNPRQVVGVRLHLVPEPRNPHDPNAVAVMFCERSIYTAPDSTRIGYLSRAQARKWQPNLTGPRPVWGVLYGATRNRQPRAYLDIPTRPAEIEAFCSSPRAT